MGLQILSLTKQAMSVEDTLQQIFIVSIFNESCYKCFTIVCIILNKFLNDLLIVSMKDNFDKYTRQCKLSIFMENTQGLNRSAFLLLLQSQGELVNLLLLCIFIIFLLPSRIFITQTTSHKYGSKNII